MRNRSSAVPRAGSGASGAASGAGAQQGCDRHRQGGEDLRRGALFRQGGEGEADTFDKGSCPRLAEPIAEPGEGQLASLAELGAHRRAAEVSAGKPFP